MKFPKFHGITLAQNAFIENLRVERLDADPTPLTAGRIWFNTTEKALKYTSLGESDEVVIHTFGNKQYIEKQISEAIAELGAAFRYVGEIEPGEDEASAFDLSALESQEAGDYYKATTSGYVTLPGVRENFFVNAKDGILFNKSGSFDKVDNSNSEVQGTEDFVTVTGSTDTGFVVDIAEGFKLRVTELENKVAEIIENIGDLEELETEEKESLVKAINEARNSAGEALEALLVNINGQRATFKSGGAALNHTVPHGLDSEFVSVTVWVEGEDQIYRNDIVAVEETDNNTLTVSLTEAAKIKVVVQSLDDLTLEVTEAP